MKKTPFILLLLTLSLTGCIGTNTLNQESEEAHNSIPALSVEKPENKDQELPINDNGDGLVYRNDSDKFQFTFDEGYKNLWFSETEEVQESSDSNKVKSYSFGITGAGDPYIFTIHVYRTSWWKENAQTDEDKDSWIKGDEKTIHTSLGIFLGSNDTFTFTLWPNNQSCPDLGINGPGPLCKLTENKTEMVIKSFKIIE